MSAGVLVKILLHTDVTRYLEFKQIDGSYVYKKGAIYKVPATASEAVSTKLLGLFEKKRFKDFLQYLQKYDYESTSTQEGRWRVGAVGVTRALAPGFDAKKEPMRKLFDKYKLDKDVMDFVGHSLALNQDDDYLERPAKETMDRIALYVDSLARCVCVCVCVCAVNVITLCASSLGTASRRTFTLCTASASCRRDSRGRRA
jgi:Rab GDP dissociation inhibitor